ncbi:MAG: CRISPR-associated protein Csx20 [Desulfatiglandales bacterium]
MASSLFLLFNHELTSLQEKDALVSLGVRNIQNPPRDLKAMWSQIPPELPGIDAYLRAIKEWLKGASKHGDYVLIQGDFGACFIMVNFAFSLGLIPVYSTTERVAVERQGDDGTVKLIHQFKHHIFRRYGR